MTNNLDRTAIALDILPTVLELHSTEDSPAIAFQLADDFLAIAKEKATLPLISIFWRDETWEIVNLNYKNELVLRTPTNEYAAIPLSLFLEAFGLALKGPGYQKGGAA